MSIEVEIRSFITEKQYSNLLSKFSREGTVLESDTQETVYFKGEQDFRIQRGERSAKFVLKGGKIHDEAREEIEVTVQPSDFPTLKRMVSLLGYEPDIIWHRNRTQFEWQGISVSLDITRGYGRILELERIVETPTEATRAQAELEHVLAEIGIPRTPRSEFEKAFQNYQTHWRELMSGL